MIARLIISSAIEVSKEEILKTLASHIGSGNTSHPDLLYFPADSKLGIEQARKIKDHFSFKPYQTKGKAVVLEDASNLTIEAQNALLKILEELPKDAIFILCADSDAKLLPTIISRCQVITLKSISDDTLEYHSEYKEDLTRLLASTIEEKFEYVERLKDKEEFFHSLLIYFHKQLPTHTEFTKKLLQAEQWQKQNVNIRAILEYLMLVMPQKL